MNIRFLSLLHATPWAIRQQELLGITGRVAKLMRGDPEEDLAENGRASRTVGGRKCQTLSKPGRQAAAAVVQVWGILGRGWEWYEKEYFGCIDVDDLMPAIAGAPPGMPVILWIRSPGGISTGIPEMAEFLREQRETREVIAFTDDLCASAAYWLASQCDRIVATPTADLGSIGVYIAMYDWSGYLEKLGIKLDLFRAGSMKGMGLPGHSLTEQERAYLQARVDQVNVAFRADVLANREIADETMQGQTYSGRDAAVRNLCDGFARSAEEFLAGI